MFSGKRNHIRFCHAALFGLSTCILIAGCTEESVLEPSDGAPAASFLPYAEGRSLQSLETWNQAHPVPFATLEKEQEGPFPKAGMFLITSAREWEKCMEELMAENALNVSPPPPIPDVDWSREGVILITLGIRPTTCYDLEISGVRRHGSTVLVHVDRSRPKLGGRYCYQNYITPYHLVRIKLHPSMRRIREI